MSLIYRDDVGVNVKANLQNLTIPVGATVSFIVHKPSGATAEWATTLDTLLGTCTYKTIAGDLSLSGEHQVQAYGIFPAGETLRSNIGTFYVYEKIS